MPKFKFGKLVRDNIVDQLKASGAKPIFRTLDPDEHLRELVKKLAEEAQEITQATRSELAGEIADVQQALDDLKYVCHLSDAAISKAQAAKNTKNGRFRKGLYVEHVEAPEDYPWVAYYRKNADRYPEIDEA